MLVSATLVLFVIGVVIGSSSADEQRDKVLDFHLDCLGQHGVTEQELHDAFDGKGHRTDKDFYNHFFCSAVKGGLMTKDGKIELDDFSIKMKDVILPENMANVEALVRKCLIQKNTVANTVRDAVDCFLKEDHNL